MLKFDRYGIYCEPARIYIDPWKPVERAIITHAHSDHARWGNKHYLAHHFTVPILKLRLGDIAVQGVEYGETFTINGVQISLHPAGHIPGSAQVRLEYQGKVWVVSGDYKLQHDGISTPFETIKCNHFVTESTFGLPIYKFPESEYLEDAINTWWQNNRAQGNNSVIIGYALGKAQRIIKHLDPSNGAIFTHGAVGSILNAMKGINLQLPETLYASAFTKKDDQGSIIVAPPSAIGTPWLKRFLPFSLGICSGWMQLRGARRRRGADRGFALSDHADWNQLNTAITNTGAENIYVTHGYKSSYARWLRENHKLNAVEVDTLYEGENIEENKPEEIPQSTDIDESVL
ncbi:MAG: exonuclease of the beta-lactamase fold involved in processing [Bacteroidota bacterium]|nr:exonuclease of the beta-lactamase fold involved in processing [Bacteroidota bacterium]